MALQVLQFPRSPEYHKTPMMPVQLRLPEFTYELIRSSRRTIGITVHRTGRVVVRAPLRAPYYEIESFVEGRSGWVVKHLDRFRDTQPTKAAPQFVNDERHLFLGLEYPLRVLAGRRPRVTLSEGRLEIVSPCAESSTVGKLLAAWYRARAHEELTASFHRCLATFPKCDIPPVSLTVRRFKSRWGSCIGQRRISLNIDLVRAPRECIDYVTVHEICHLFVPNHSRRFYRLMDEAMPDWRERRAVLERLLA